MIEATGIYYENPALCLAAQQQLFVPVVLPNKAKKYKEALSLKSKTDGIDAYAMSRIACEQTLLQWNAPSEKIYELRRITRQIESLTGQITAAANQLEAITHGALL